MTDTDIESLIRGFEDGSLPKAEWTHKRHLLMALWYIWHHGRDVATGLIRDGIRSYNARHGNPTGDHETITLAWVTVIERFLSEQDRNTSLSQIAMKRLAECGDRDDLLRFYTRERLFSDEARARWISPDKAEIRCGCR